MPEVEEPPAARRPAPDPAGQDVAEHVAFAAFQPLWRRHSDAINRALLHRWLPGGTARRVLKTDLFDEAVSGGLHDLLAARSEATVGIDVSAQAIVAARARHPGLEAVRADVRELPFADGAFDVVVSLSTLDHFRERGGLAAGLRELHRVLEPGGTLVLTLDNAANPVVALRNALPFAPLHRLGVLPYYVGRTAGPGALRRLVREAGFGEVELTSVMHCPRVPGVLLASVLGRRLDGRLAAGLLRVLARLEVLERLPTRWWTGYFLAVRATRLP